MGYLASAEQVVLFFPLKAKLRLRLVGVSRAKLIQPQMDLTPGVSGCVDTPAPCFLGLARGHWNIDLEFGRPHCRGVKSYLAREGPLSLSLSFLVCKRIWTVVRFVGDDKIANKAPSIMPVGKRRSLSRPLECYLVPL